jgi:NADH-quinone oxidoreductase subunit F
VDNIEGKSFCPLGDAASWPIQSAIKKFPEDFRRKVLNGNGHVKDGLPTA